MTHVFKVGGMSCQHCVDAVTKAVSGAVPDTEIKVDLSGGTVTVGKDVEAEGETAVRDAIETAGFEFLGPA